MGEHGTWFDYLNRFGVVAQTSTHRAQRHARPQLEVA